MKNNTILSAGNTAPINAKKKKNILQAGFTMAELLIVIVCIGLLAAVAVPTINRVRDALSDNVKVQNADKMNEYCSALYNGGVDTSTYADGSAMITGLRAGITVPATVTGGSTMEIRLDKDVNPAAYTFTAGTASAAPRFAAITGQRTVQP